MPENERRVTELRLVITATDYERAVRFFRDVLGLPEQEAYEGNGGHVVILDAGRATLEINDPPYAEYIDDRPTRRWSPSRRSWCKARCCMWPRHRGSAAIANPSQTSLPRRAIA